jgi:hypothetical protein
VTKENINFLLLLHRQAVASVLLDLHLIRSQQSVQDVRAVCINRKTVQLTSAVQPGPHVQQENMEVRPRILWIASVLIVQRRHFKKMIIQRQRLVLHIDYAQQVNSVLQPVAVLLTAPVNLVPMESFKKMLIPKQRPVLPGKLVARERT